MIFAILRAIVIVLSLDVIVFVTACHLDAGTFLAFFLVPMIPLVGVNFLLAIVIAMASWDAIRKRLEDRA